MPFLHGSGALKVPVPLDLGPILVAGCINKTTAQISGPNFVIDSYCFDIGENQNATAAIHFDIGWH